MTGIRKQSGLCPECRPKIHSKKSKEEKKKREKNEKTDDIIKIDLEEHNVLN
jgi:hypothetical protein